MLKSKTNKLFFFLVILVISCKNKTEEKITNRINVIPTANRTSTFDISTGMKELSDFLKTSCNNNIHYSGTVKCRFIIENECNIEKIKILSDPYNIEVEQLIENELNKLSSLKKIECNSSGIYMLPLIQFD